MATASDMTIVEVEEIVEAGQLNPDEIQVPGIFVKRIFKGNKFEKRIEKLIFDKNSGVKQSTKKPKNDVIREKIAKRAVKEVTDGMYVNLGVGIPTLVPAFIDPKFNIEYHGENGVLGKQ